MMTDKDKFKRAFSAVQTPDDFALDLEENKMFGKMKFKKSLIAACTALAIGISGVSCYAADVGGIQRTIQVWLHGDQTTATLSVDSDKITHYSMKDADGHEIYGGGVAGDGKGGTRALTESEVQEDLNGPEVDIRDGHVYLYYKNQKLDLTDKFDDEGLCYVTLKDGSKNIYVTVTKNGGMASSEDKYVQKDELPKEWFENS